MAIDIFSVALYTAVFGVATTLFHLSESKKKCKKIVFGLVAVCILCFFAGFRDNSIGRDIQNYVQNYYQAFYAAGSFSQAINLVRFTQLEPLYILLLFVTSRVTGDLWLILFMLQFLTVFPVFLAVLKWNKELHISIGFAMAIYILVFYNNSFNIMRQSVAAAFLFLGTTYLIFINKNDYCFYLIKKKKEKKLEILIIIASYIVAYGFHKSALMGFALVFVAFLLKDAKKWMFLAIPSALIALYYVSHALFAFLVKRVSFSPSILFYIRVFILQTEKTDWMLDHYTNTLLFDFLFRTVVILIPYALIKKYNQYEWYVRVLTLIGYISYCFPWITMKTIYGQRISMYADFFLIALLPYVLTKQFKPRYAVCVTSYALLSFYWFVWIIIVKWADSNVYRFRF